MRQRGLTVITRIRTGKTEELRELLNFIGTHIEDNDKIAFERLSRVHFMRWVVLDGTVIRGKKIPDQLVLSTNFDGSIREHLEELIEIGGAGLREIYALCEGFASGMDAGAFLRYLRSHKRKNAAFYVGKAGRTVQQVHDEYGLNAFIQNHLQEAYPSQRWDGTNPQNLRKEIGQKVADSPFAWAGERYRDTFMQRMGPVLLIGIGALVILGGLAALIWGFFCCPWGSVGVLGAVMLFVLWWWLSLKANEKRDRAAFSPSPKNIKHIGKLFEREDYRVQNQLTHLVEVKPGLFRAFTLRFVLWAINLLARTVYNRGSLGGIPTIHFARWAIIDGGRRLLFFSNFDGSWESYLGDFIDRAAIGLTGVWCNTRDFPPTRNLIRSGARNSRYFKAWSRAKQVQTQVWYSAYKTITVKNANQNTLIRQGLAGELNDEKTKAWLKLL